MPYTHGAKGCVALTDSGQLSKKQRSTLPDTLQVGGPDKVTFVCAAVHSSGLSVQPAHLLSFCLNCNAEHSDTDLATSAYSLYNRARASKVGGARPVLIHASTACCLRMPISGADKNTAGVGPKGVAAMRPGHAVLRRPFCSSRLNSNCCRTYLCESLWPTCPRIHLQMLAKEGCDRGQNVKALLANPLGPLQEGSLDIVLYRSVLGSSPDLQ